MRFVPWQKSLGVVLDKMLRVVLEKILELQRQKHCHVQLSVWSRQCRSSRRKMSSLGFLLARGCIGARGWMRAVGLEREDALWRGVPACSLRSVGICKVGMIASVQS